MELLLDTHILLWALTDDDRLPVKARELIENQKNSIYYSIASMWEVSIKNALKKLPVSGVDFMHYCEQAGFRKLPVDDRHVASLETLSKKENTPPHNDPFDRILLSQAKADCMLFVTHDEKFACYDEPVLAIV